MLFRSRRTRGRKAGTELPPSPAAVSKAPLAASTPRVRDRKRGTPVGAVPPPLPLPMAGRTPATPRARDVKVMTPPCSPIGDAVAGVRAAPRALTPSVSCGWRRSALEREPRPNFQRRSERLANRRFAAVFHRLHSPCPQLVRNCWGQAAAIRDLSTATDHPAAHSSDWPWARIWSQICFVTCFLKPPPARSNWPPSLLLRMPRLPLS